MLKHLLFTLTMLLSSYSLSATVFNVSSLSDSGAGTLRQAVIDANADSSDSKECPHQIIFDVAGTVTPASTITFTKSIEIRGHSGGTIIDGGGTVALFQITTDSKKISFIDLTCQNAFKNGNGAAIYIYGEYIEFETKRCTFLGNETTGNGPRGAAIYIYSIVGSCNLSVTDCLFDGNTNYDGGSAIYAIGEIIITNSTFQNNSGTGVQAWAAVSLTGGPGIVKNCYFYNNDAVFGGGLRTNQLEVTIENCLFENNEVSGSGGKGAGLYCGNNSTGLVTIKNCTFTGNTAVPAHFGSGAGVYAINVHDIYLENNTFSGNTSDFSSAGGISLVGSSISAVLQGNIFFDNTPYDIYSNVSTALTSTNFDIVGTCQFAGGTCPTFYSTNDPDLGALMDNGGATHTMEPNAGSNAIDAMGVTGPDVDQRGYERDGTNNDIGAVETGLSCDCNPNDAEVVNEPGIHRSSVANTIGGITYYCDASCNLLLALEVGSSGAVIPDDGVEILIGAAATYHSSGTGFISNPDGGAMMSRSWLVNPTTQPSSDMVVIFYISSDDQDAVDLALTNNGQSPSSTIKDFQFYKTVTGNDYDPICELEETDVIIIENGAPATTDIWKYEPIGDNLGIKFLVSSFSGGGGGAAAGGGNFLPVEWLSFTAQKTKEEVVLNWETASEINNLGFHVERRSENNEWEKLGFRPGNGSEFLGGRYHFIDPNPILGDNYYRLTQEDFDGTVSYSKINVVSFKQVDDQPTIYPNPVRNELMVDGIFDESKINLYDVNGKVLFEQTVSENITIDMNHLPKGLYILQINSSQFNWQESVLKQ